MTQLGGWDNFIVAFLMELKLILLLLYEVPVQIAEISVCNYMSLEQIPALLWII